MCCDIGVGVCGMRVECGVHMTQYVVAASVTCFVSGVSTAASVCIVLAVFTVWFVLIVSVCVLVVSGMLVERTALVMLVISVVLVVLVVRVLHVAVLYCRSFRGLHMRIMVHHAICDVGSEGRCGYRGCVVSYGVVVVVVWNALGVSVVLIV